MLGALILLLSATLLMGCSGVSNKTLGLAGGAAAGGVVGNLASGGSAAGTAVGAIAGGALGYEIGKHNP